ncbi:MAG: hypothetical protein ABIA59_05385 [Candidatus Latescibacterota bacterium]
MMKRLSVLFVICAVLLIISAPVTYAQVPTHIEYGFSGFGNFMVSPVHYTGSINSGEPTLVGGTWNINVDDTGWPPDTDQLVRWNYIDATYFAPNYDAMFGAWTGSFDEHSTASSPTWGASAALGSLGGTANLQVTISDFDFDGVIDADERSFSIFSGTLIVVKNGTGIWAGYCGLGSFSGNAMNNDPWNFADDYVEGYTILDIEDCGVPVENVTWGSVKNIYR